MMLGAIVALASCQKDAGLDGVGDGEMVDVTLSASVATASATRAEGDDFTAGDGTTVDRCILEVYTGDVLYKRMVTSVTDLTASFDLRLVSSQTYEFLLWADKGALETTDDSGDGVVGGGDTHYITTNTAGLKGITTSYADYVGNDETRDAFYYYEKMDIEASTAITAALTRPFGQVNVKTYLTDVPSDMYPASVKIEYTTTVGNTFDISTGSVSNDTEINWSASAAVIDGSDDAISSNYIDLSTDYLFASATEQDLHKFTIYFYSDEAGESEITSNENFVNIPVQRNYQTNISGELLTKGAAINVTITPAFTEPDIDVDVKEVATVSDLNDELVADAGSSTASYSVVEEVSDGTTIAIPATATTTETTSRSIVFSGGVETDANIVIEDTNNGDASSSVSELYITVAEGENVTVELNMPNSTVYINGTVVENVSTWASENTTIIAADTTITGTLTVMQGNVEIYGTVNEIVVDSSNTAAGTIKVFDDGVLTTATNIGSYTVLYVVSTEAELIAMLADDSVESITLTSDVTLTTPLTITKPITLAGDLTFDGGDQLLTMSGAGRFVVDGNVTMNKMSIASTTTIRTGTIYVESANSTLTINNSTIDYNLAGSSGVLNDGIVVVNPASGVDNVDVVISNSTLNINGKYQSGVAFMPTVQQSGSSLTLDNTLIHATSDDPNNATYTTGLSLGKVDGFKFEVKNGSEIRNVYYGYYGYATYLPTNIDIDIVDSEVSGYGIMFRGIGGTFDIKNSTITGRNYYSSNSDFATIVLTYDGTDTAASQNIAMTIDNSTIKSYRSGVCSQWTIEVRKAANTGNTINIINGSKFIDEVADGVDYMTYLIEFDESNGTVVTTDGTEILEGGNEVRLLQAITLAGAGTKDDPYQISKAYEMTGIVSISGYYKLMNDIDLTGYSWGNLDVNADGEFDGNDCTLSNYNYVSTYIPTNTLGLFSDVNGVVKNLTLKNSSFSIAETGWSTIISCGGIAGSCAGSIIDCTVEADIQIYNNAKAVYGGGIAGKLAGGTISGCTFSGSITKDSRQTYDTYSGGIAGWLSTSGSTIKDCAFEGEVTGTYAATTVAYIGSYTLTESGNTSTGVVNGETVIQ